MIYSLVYVKIVDHKKNGLTMSGPTMYDIKESEEEINAIAAALTAKAKNCMIICKVYKMETIFEMESVLTDSKSYFKNMHSNMLEAKEILINNRKRK
jgi:hypothetical protein